MTFREFTGKNVEQAIRSAMAEFESDLSELDIEILSQGSRGVLGVGAEEARILAAPKSAGAVMEAPRPDAADADAEGEWSTATTAGIPITPEEAEALPDERGAARPRGRGGRPRGGMDREPARAGRDSNGRGRDRGRGRTEGRRDREGQGERREPTPFVSAKPREELSDEERATLDTAKEVLEEMLRLMGVEGTVEIASGAETSRLNVRGDELGSLIGRRGEKLASLQHIVNLIVGRRVGQHHRVAVDVENYRGRREEQLRDVADRAAKRVVQTGKILQLEAMSAVERRIVHMALVENPKVRTQSVGVEPNRRIVVLPASTIKE